MNINIITMFLLITVSLFFIINMIDGQLLKNNETLKSFYENEQKKTDILLAIIHEIQKELRLTQLKECPQEELRQISKEIIEWIDTLDKGTEEICQEANEE